mmetsp:Transcript_20175/g.29741  ORF Transcript_20175/g.29741 Transcript_20175/m.29741 type:complete len:104 (+) Transcript_20175:189-500(+)
MSINSLSEIFSFNEHAKGASQTQKRSSTTSLKRTANPNEPNEDIKRSNFTAGCEETANVSTCRTPHGCVKKQSPVPYRICSSTGTTANLFARRKYADCNHMID